MGAGAFTGRTKIAERRVRQWSKFGAPVELLSRDQVSQMLGSDAWFGGFRNKTGGHINPLALSRGMARVVLDLGCRIYARSPAISFERRNDRWVVKTEKGEISGRALVLATNAYTGEFSNSLAPDIAHEAMPILSWQMATQPLSDAARKTVIPGRQAMSDTHGELYFARFDARNRLVTGGAVIGPGNKAERIKTRVAERLQRLWPQIGRIEFDYIWNGYVGMTTDFLPAFIASGPTPLAGPAATVARSRWRSRSAMSFPRRCGAFRKKISRCRSPIRCRSWRIACCATSRP